MADKDLGDGPSLEMPSLGSLFRRKKGKQEPEQDDSLTPTQAELDAVIRGKAPSKKPEEQAEKKPAVEPEEQPAVEPEDEVAVGTPEREHTAVIDAVPDSASVAAEPLVDAPTEPQASQEASAASETDAAPAADTSETAASATDGVPPTSTARATVSATEVKDKEDVVADKDDDEDADADDEAAPRSGRSFSLPAFALPAVPGRLAAALTGLTVGVLAVVMTYGAVQGCEAVKGTSTCGTPGFFLLIAIMILLVVLGSALLGAWKVTDPGSTSFLGVGLVAVIALLFLIRVIFSPWMIVVIPLVAIVTFVVSQWLTSLFIEDHGTPE